MNLIITHKFGVYIDWTLESESRPYYVGKGVQGRILQLKRRSKLHESITQKYGQHRTVVFETDNEEEAFVIEAKLIEELHTKRTKDNWWGANFTDGGEGCVGAQWSDETKERNRQSHLRRKDEYSLRMKEHWSDPEKRKQHTRALCDRWTNELRTQHSTAAKKRWSDPEQRSHASEAAKKRWSDPEQRRHKSEMTRLNWENPEYRAKFVYDDEKRARMSKTLKEKWKDPEVKAEMLRKRKLTHAANLEKSKTQQQLLLESATGSV